MPAQPATQGLGDGANSLADVLLLQKVITKDAADKIKLAEVQTGTSQEDILLKEGRVSEADLARAKATLYNIPFIDLATSPVSPEAMAALPQEVAQKFKVYPVAIDKPSKVLTLADRKSVV